MGAQEREGPDPDPGAGGGGRESGRHEVVASDLRLHSLRCHSPCYHCSASYQYLVYEYPSTIQYFVTFIHKYENAKYILYSQHTCCNKVITIKMSGSLKMSLRRNVLSNCRHCHSDPGIGELELPPDVPSSLRGVDQGQLVPLQRGHCLYNLSSGILFLKLHTKFELDGVGNNRSFPGHGPILAILGDLEGRGDGRGGL